MNGLGLNERTSGSALDASTSGAHRKPLLDARYLINENVGQTAATTAARTSAT